MTFAAWVLLLCTATVAVADWVAVELDRRSAEIVLKPLTMVLLIATVLAMDPSGSAEDAQAWFVGALALSMVGDVLLLWSERTQLFIGGLAAFLLGHVAYVVGMLVLGTELVPLVLGVAVVAVGLATLGRRIVNAVALSDEPELAGPVIAYVGVISVMVIAAFGTGRAAAMLGATSFYLSDAQIAWNRFIDELPHGRLLVMVTYHVGQVALVLALGS